MGFPLHKPYPYSLYRCVPPLCLVMVGECTSLIIYNSTMSACEKAKRWKEAAMLLGNVTLAIHSLVKMQTNKPKWWFQICCIFMYFSMFGPLFTWGNDPIWWIFFRWVGKKNTNVGCCKNPAIDQLPGWWRWRCWKILQQTLGLVFFVSLTPLFRPIFFFFGGGGGGNFWSPTPWDWYIQVFFVYGTM